MEEIDDNKEIIILQNDEKPNEPNEELIIKNLSHLIDLNPSKNKFYTFPTYNTSYKIYHNECFDIDSLMYYLSTRDQIGTTDELINSLYEKFQNDSLFYIPQLCSFLTYKEYITPIENYILDICVDRMKFSLTTFWMTFANQDSKQMEQLQQNIETTLVNNRRYNLKSNKYCLNNNRKSIVELEENLIRESFIKEFKLKYFDYVFKFYNDFIVLCDNLKEISKCDRDEELRKYLNKCNKKIKSEKKKSKDSMPQLNLLLNYFYEGILLPFNDDIDTSDIHCSIIVNFIPELSKCYHSKARVPILLTVECVKLYEIQEIENNIKSYSSLEAFLELNDNNNNDNIIIDENEKKNKDENNDKDSNKNCVDQFYIYIPDDNLKIIEYFGQKYSSLIKEKKKKSKYKNYETYSLKSFIFKSKDDLRQELLTLQLIKKCKLIFDNARIGLKLYPYEILITSKESGLMEFLPNTISVDQLKKKYPKKDLNLFFREVFDDQFDIAQKNFCESLAAYSLVCYLLEIRDRHNGNILIDMNGNLIHIDFGFILGIGPGGTNFEKAPFKLTEEYVEIMDGIDSQIFQYFKSLLYIGFIEIRKHFDILWKIIEITYNGNKDLPCFLDRDIKDIKKSFEQKFLFDIPEIELSQFVDPLIEKSYANGTTSKYDTFQSFTNGISN